MLPPLIVPVSLPLELERFNQILCVLLRLPSHNGVALSVGHIGPDDEFTSRRCARLCSWRPRGVSCRVASSDLDRPDLIGGAVEHMAGRTASHRHWGLASRLVCLQFEALPSFHIHYTDLNFEADVCTAPCALRGNDPIDANVSGIGCLDLQVGRWMRWSCN